MHACHSTPLPRTVYQNKEEKSSIVAMEGRIWMEIIMKFDETGHGHTYPGFRRQQKVKTESIMNTQCIWNSCVPSLYEPGKLCYNTKL